MQTVDETLAERGGRYGDFRTHAMISQQIMERIKSFDGWERFDHVKREGVTLIVHKLARALNGDPEYRDNWHDIAGYAKLIEDRCSE